MFLGEKTKYFFNNCKYLSFTLMTVKGTIVNKTDKSPYISGAYVSWRKQANKISKIYVK